VTWEELAVAAGFQRDVADHVLWNCSAFPFAAPRVIWYQLRHAARFAHRYGVLPEGI
jgi:hypothetical protein